MINLTSNDINAIILSVIIVLTAVMISVLIIHLIDTFNTRADIRDQIIINATKNQTADLTIQLQGIQSLQQQQIKSQTTTNNILSQINKKLDIVPVTPIQTPTPDHNKNCNIYSKQFPFCVLPNYNSHS